jgi:hypothetical protein
MKRSTESVEAGQLRPALSVGLACALFASAMLAHAAVTPPPLPLGSAQVVVEPGMNKEERKREDRAHHHKGQNGKDINKDDSEDKGNGKNDDKGSKK